MTARTKNDAKRWSHDLTGSELDVVLSIAGADPLGMATTHMDIRTRDGYAVALRFDTEELRPILERTLERINGAATKSHLCVICGIHHGIRRPANAEPRFIVTGLTAHAEVGMFYAQSIEPADPGDVQACWTVQMQAPGGQTGETAEWRGTRWSSYTSPALRSLLRRGDLTGAYRYAAGKDLIDMLETGYISALKADIEPSTIERDSLVFTQWMNFAREQDAYWKPATMHAGSQPEPAEA